MKCQTIIACFFHLKLILDLGARLRPAQRVQHLAPVAVRGQRRTVLILQNRLRRVLSRIADRIDFMYPVHYLPRMPASVLPVGRNAEIRLHNGKRSQPKPVGGHVGDRDPVLSRRERELQRQG